MIERGHPFDVLAPSRPAAGSAPRWFVTLVDLMSLLLAFFVLLFAMSAPKSEEWRALTDSLARRLNAGRTLPSGELPATPGRGTVAPSLGLGLDYLHALLETKIAGDALLGAVRLERQADRLIIMLPADLAFAPGEAALTRAAMPAIGALADAVRFLGNDVEVQGHADPRPAPSAGYASNWELSLARAAAVADALAEAGAGRHPRAYGRGAGRFAEDAARFRFASDDRMAFARRVDIIVLATQSSATGG
jgi:chemotaxis protein MotB